MKVLLVCADLGRTGGIQNYVKDIARAVESGNEIQIVELKGPGMPGKIIFAVEVFFRALFFHPDVVLCAHVNFSPLCHLIGSILGRKYVVFAYGIDAWNITNNGQKAALRQAEKIVAVSNFTASEIERQFPEFKPKITVIPGAVDADRFHIRPKPQYLIERYHVLGKKVIFTLARLSGAEGYKGYDKVIEALPIIARSIPEVVYLIGGDGDDRSRIERLVKEKHLADRVIIAGKIPDKELNDHYNLCDVFAMPSKGEGFGIVFLEALACGKPVVAGNRDGSRDAVLDGKLGTLVDPDNINDVADGIISALDSRAMSGDYLRKEVLGYYGLDGFGDKVRQLLHELQR